MKVHDRKFIIYILIYTIGVFCVGYYTYSIKNKLEFWFDEPLEATYIGNDVEKEEFIFEVFRYGKMSVPYKTFSANQQTANIIDALLEFNKISFVVYPSNNGVMKVYIAYSNKSLLLNSTFDMLFHGKEK